MQPQIPKAPNSHRQDRAPSTATFLASHLHSGVLAGVSYACFQSLVDDPPSALLSTLPLLALTQITYVVLCLEPGNGGSKGKRLRASKKGENITAGISSRVLPAFLSLLLASTVGTVILHICMVLFGAPVTSHFAHTALCALHVALLIPFPLIYANGVDGQRWRDIMSVSMPMDGAFGGAIGALLGAWLGAVPIPLDWDREWQKWPVTILTGAYMGYLVGKSLGTTFHGKRLPF